MGINHANGAFKIYYALKPRRNTHNPPSIYLCICNYFCMGWNWFQVLNGFFFFGLSSVWA